MARMVALDSMDIHNQELVQDILSSSSGSCEQKPVEGILPASAPETTEVHQQLFHPPASVASHASGPVLPESSVTDFLESPIDQPHKDNSSSREVNHLMGTNQNENPHDLVSEPHQSSPEFPLGISGGLNLLQVRVSFSTFAVALIPPYPMQCINLRGMSCVLISWFMPQMIY